MSEQQHNEQPKQCPICGGETELDDWDCVSIICKGECGVMLSPDAWQRLTSQTALSADLEAQRDQLHTALERILQAGDGLAKADAALQEYNAVHGDYSYTLNDAVDAALRRYTAAYAAARAALKLKRSE